MPQFDVHLNPGPQRGAVPLVVLVQSALFDGYRRRVVVPLVLRSALPAGGAWPARA
jgi:toxin CcdB